MVKEAFTKEHSRLLPLQVWRTEPKLYFTFHLLGRSASGTNRLPLCRWLHVMDGSGRRDPLVYAERLIWEVMIGPSRGLWTQGPCLPTFGSR